MIRSVIIDDEKNCRETLQMLLNGYFDNVEVLGMAENATEGFELIKKHKPDLVFLDIMMPDKDGFELLSTCEDISFEVIFTTAYDEYAIKALRFSALDYLLKPVSRQHLKDAIARFQTKISHFQNEETYTGPRIFLYANGKYTFVFLKNIIRLEANGRQVTFVLNSKNEIVVNKSISEYESLINGGLFFKTHRSHIINLLEIKEYVPDKHGGIIIMNDKKMVPLAEAKSKEFEAWLSSKV